MTTVLLKFFKFACIYIYFYYNSKMILYLNKKNMFGKDSESADFLSDSSTFIN